MRNRIWKQCKSKRRYRDEHMAHYYQKLFEKERGTKLDYYWCSFCNGYHLTSLMDVSKYYHYEEPDWIPAVAAD